MHVPAVVHAIFCNATSMLTEGVPLMCGTTITAVVEPQAASARAAIVKKTAPIHVFLALAVTRLMTFPVFFRHLPLCR
jgi:hypothetical protein